MPADLARAFQDLADDVRQRTGFHVRVTLYPADEDPRGFRIAAPAPGDIEQDYDSALIDAALKDAELRLFPDRAEELTTER